MSQKVWVIDELPEKQVSSTTTSRTKNSLYQQNSAPTRNPLLAYSLSMIIWGCGQFYNGQWKSGILFLSFMLMFSAFMGIAVLYWESVQFFFESLSVDASGTLLICGLFYVSGLIVWQFNAWQAYLRSAKTNTHYLRGVTMPVLPAVCSLLMPGWGQVLNGQAKKGLFFQVFALTGLAAAPSALIIIVLWPTLDASRSRLIVEWVLSISVMLSPLILILWISNVIDAAKVSSDNTKKERLPRRIRYAANRFRYSIQIYGWKNAVLPIVKRTALVILLLILCGITFHYVPRAFYMQKLENLAKGMSEKEMTVIPGIIEKLPHRISSGN